MHAQPQNQELVSCSTVLVCSNFLGCSISMGCALTLQSYSFTHISLWACLLLSHLDHVGTLFEFLEIVFSDILWKLMWNLKRRKMLLAVILLPFFALECWEALLPPFPWHNKMKTHLELDCLLEWSNIWWQSWKINGFIVNCNHFHHTFAHLFDIKLYWGHQLKVYCEVQKEAFSLSICGSRLWSWKW